jgi:uncharacterized membrane protein YeaQ/YmgE (transglycosylase-associated protein family)
MLYLLIWLAFGSAVGLFFKLVLARYFGGVLITVVLGIIGAVAGGFTAVVLGFESFQSLPLAAIGAIVFLVADGIISNQNNSPTTGNDYLPETRQFTNLNPPPTQREFLVKRCPMCGHTYSDISLNFCLDDGATLSGVIKMQAHGNPEETVFFNKPRS